MADKEHNVLADESFKQAETHADAGHHSDMWAHLGRAQMHASNHAKQLAEGGQHGAALAYRKIAVGRAHHISSKIKKSLDEFQMCRYSAMNALWALMKQQKPGWQNYRYAIPQIELAKSPKDIDDILGRYGIALKKCEELEKVAVADAHREAFNHHASLARKYQVDGTAGWANTRTEMRHMELAQEHGWKLGYKDINNIHNAIDKVKPAKHARGVFVGHPNDHLVEKKK